MASVKQHDTTTPAHPVALTEERLQELRAYSTEHDPETLLDVPAHELSALLSAASESLRLTAELNEARERVKAWEEAMPRCCSCGNIATRFDEDERARCDAPACVPHPKGPHECDCEELLEDLPHAHLLRGKEPKT